MASTNPLQGFRGVRIPYPPQTISRNSELHVKYLIKKLLRYKFWGCCSDGGWALDCKSGT